jgi:predicted PurR-regulated permease PerM
MIESPGEGVDVPRQPLIGFALGVGGGIVGALTVFVIAFYYLMEKVWLRRLILLEIAPGPRERVDRIWGNVEAKVGDWLRGQLLLCLAIGMTATIGYGVLGVRFWPLLGLWAGLTEIIPIIGPWLGGVPAVIIALTQSWNKALLVIGFILLLQLLENTVLVPRIMRGAVGLTPLTVFVAILAGTQFLGVLGALLAIPVAAAVQVVLSDYFEARREAKRTGGAALPGWRWMRGPLTPVPLQPAPVDPAEIVRATPPAGTGPTSTSAPGWTSDVLARAATSPNED